MGKKVPDIPGVQRGKGAHTIGPYVSKVSIVNYLSFFIVVTKSYI